MDEIDIIMWDQMQGYRKRWHKARKAVEENDTLDVDFGVAHRNYHFVTWQWVRRLLPIDTVENEYQAIWHDRQFGEFEGLAEAFEAGLEFEGVGADEIDPLPVETLHQVGGAAEEMTVDVMDLADPAPVVEPWEPRDAEEVQADIEELKDDLPDHIDLDDL